MLLPFQGACSHITKTRGAASLAPGYGLAAPAGRTRKHGVSHLQMLCILFANAVYLIYKNIAPDFQSITICVLWDVICTVCEYLRQNTSPYAAKPPLAAGGAEMAHFRLKQDALTVRYLRNGRIKAACKESREARFAMQKCPYRTAIWALLHCDMGTFARQYESLHGKTGRFRR